VQRAGDVIPLVAGPVLSKRTGKEKRFRPPRVCPACKTKLVRPEGEVMRYCPNRACPAQLFRLLTHFVSRGAMDIDGVGEQLSLTLLREGLVKDLAAIYFLKKDDLLGLERMAEKSAQNVIDAIDGSRTRSLSRVLFALGIRHVGSETAVLLAQHFGSMEAIAGASVEELAAVPTIGPVVAESVHEYFRDKQNRRLIDKLRKGGVRMKADAPAAREGPLAGQSFVITGTLGEMTRPDAEARIRSLGGATSSSVTKSTGVLVAGESPGSKLEKAQKYGTTVMSDDELMALLRRHGAA
ncbi:MAG: helix-hairpin-helix domain-containing protein, partial [Dehalococcoidia bacterium]